MNGHSRDMKLIIAAICLCACLDPARAETKGPLKVFILAGQSNMEGKAAITTLDAVMADPAMGHNFRRLKPNGQWIERDDVWVTYLDRRDRGREVPKYGPLSVGFGSPKTVRSEDRQRVQVNSLRASTRPWACKVSRSQL